MTFLSNVFNIHRFIAAFFGAALLFIPERTSDIITPGRPMALEEKFAVQSWACFMLGVAYIAHCAPSFEPRAQRAVAKGLALCFFCESSLYLYTLGTAKLDQAWFNGIAAIGTVFFLLFAAYLTGLRYKND
jgi:hypothetical protein